jgi:hypothetical protein
MFKTPELERRVSTAHFRLYRCALFHRRRVDHVRRARPANITHFASAMGSRPESRHGAYVGRHLRDDGRFSRLGGAHPIKALPLIDFVIVSGAIHATTMAFDACHMPGLSQHLAFRGDVMGTYVAPITLALTHPRRFYLLQRKRA